MVTDLIIKNAECDTETGFFYIEFEGTVDTIQCCIEQKEQSNEDFYKNGPIFLEKIDSGDSGYNRGNCRDCNEWAFKQYGDDAVLGLLLSEAKKHGIEVL